MTPEERAEYEREREAGYAALRRAHEIFMRAAERESIVEVRAE